MSEIKTGGPAFPQIAEIGDIAYTTSGMTLRDAMAISALQGICAHPDTWGLDAEQISKHAYILADAMLRAREA